MAFVKLTGTGTAGAFVKGDPFGFQHANYLRLNLNLLALGVFGRNQYWGGDENLGMAFAGIWDVYGQGDGFEIDNTSNQISGSAGVVVLVRVRLRVSDASISITPRIYNVTDSAVATSSGAAACSATATDFSGSNQQQTLALTLASGKKKYKLQITQSSASYQGFASGVMSDIYVA